MDIHTIIAFLEKSGLQISQHSLREYWSHHQQVGETWAQHGEHDRIPLGIYGDSARCATTFGFINLIGIFCNVILWKPKAVRYSRFLVFAIPEQSLWRHHTLNVVYRRICWSLNCLYDGLHPNKGPYEEDLPAHLAALSGSNFANRYMVTEIRGDWQWHKKVWRFERCSWIAVNMCHQCPAKSVSNNPRDLYWMFDDNSWEDCPFTTDQFIAERIPSRGICPFVALHRATYVLIMVHSFLAKWLLSLYWSQNKVVMPHFLDVFLFWYQLYSANPVGMMCILSIFDPLQDATQVRYWDWNHLIPVASVGVLCMWYISGSSTLWTAVGWSFH